jgi:hypothetical protein
VLLHTAGGDHMNDEVDRTKQLAIYNSLQIVVFERISVVFWVFFCTQFDFNF